MSVPIWRFCLSPGVAGASGVIGVLMPSVDRVGRRFPLTLVGPLPDSMPVIEAHLSSDDTFEMLETIALSVLDDDLSKDILAERLEGVGFSAVHAVTACSVVPGSSVVCRAKTSQQMVRTTTAELLARSFASPTIWSTLMEEDSRLMVCDGLPDGLNMQGLFDLDADLWREGIL
jgi:type VI secretion system protein ImpM